MASTIANYQGNGSTTDFSVPFDYLAKKFVKVTVDSREKLGGDYGDTTKDYFFVDKTTIRFNTAPASGTEIIIRRYTSATDRIVSFKDASVLKAKDLDVSTIQTIHIAEEGRDIINDALIVDKEGNWDAKGHRIVNVGDPIGDNDAITLKFYKDDAKGAYQAKLDAEAARDAAKVSEKNAKASEVNAKESEVNAKASAGTAVSAAKHADTVMAENQAIIEEARQIQTNIETSEKNAYENAVIATQKAEEAKVSERNAKESEVEAKKQADLAKDYAEDSQLNADWEVADPKSKAFIKNKPTLGALASKDSIAYSEITGTPPEQVLSGLATKSELKTGLAGKAPVSHTHTIANVTGLQADLTTIRESITEVSSKVDGIGDTLSPTYAKKQGILDACDKALNGANPVHAGDPTLDEIKLALATFQAQLGQLESRRYVKETGNNSDGTSWYRRWSDEWLEQGGTKVATVTSGETQTVSLPFVYKDASYNIICTGVKRKGYYGYASIEQDSVTKSSFAYAAMGNSSPDGVVKIYWYTCGYIK